LPLGNPSETRQVFQSPRGFCGTSTVFFPVFSRFGVSLKPPPWPSNFRVVNFFLTRPCFRLFSLVVDFFFFSLSFFFFLSFEFFGICFTSYPRDNLLSPFIFSLGLLCVQFVFNDCPPKQWINFFSVRVLPRFSGSLLLQNFPFFFFFSRPYPSNPFLRIHLWATRLL